MRVAAVVVFVTLAATGVAVGAATGDGAGDGAAPGVRLARAAAPASSASAPPSATGPVAASGSPAATAAAFVRCPTAKLVTKRPKPSPLPTHDPAAPVIGGPRLATTGLAVPADAPPLPKNITAKSWLVADLDSGEVIGACGAHVYNAPASVQKLLLAATVMGTLDPKRVVTVTAADLAYEPGSSAVGLVLGGKYTVATLWLGLLLNSGNDAANVLARIGSPGGVPGTVAAMNARARELGAFDTRAVTPSGLDGRGQVTSAYDLALIARACFALADFRRYVATRTAKIPAQRPRYPAFQIQNNVQFLFDYDGALGGKTGFTDIARHTFVGAAERGGRRLVVTLLGAESQPARGWQQGAALLNWAYRVAPDATLVGVEPIGVLVSPGDLTAVPSASPSPSQPPVTVPPDPLPATPTAAEPRTKQVVWWPLAVVGGLVLVVLAFLLGLGIRRRNGADPFD